MALAAIPYSCAKEEAEVLLDKKEAKKKTEILKKWVDKELKDFQKLGRLLDHAKDEKSVGKALDYARKMRQTYGVLYHKVHGVSFNSAEEEEIAGIQTKFEGINITLEELKPIHEKMADKRLSVFRKFYESSRDFTLRQYHILNRFQDLESQENLRWVENMLRVHQEDMARYTATKVNKKLDRKARRRASSSSSSSG